MMIKRIVILLLVICFFLKGFSQSDFRSGYIIRNGNDTLKGLVDYRGPVLNSAKCSFKLDNESEKLDYSPGEIESYRFINGKYYISKEISIEENVDIVFLEYLINGIVDIYYYRDGFSKDHYFVDKGDGKLIELKNEEKKVYSQGKEYIRESKEFIGVLKYIFMDSPTINQSVNHLSLGHKSLIKISNKYHNEVCSGEECIIYEKTLPKTKIILGPLVGMNFMSLTKSDQEFGGIFTYLNKSDFGICISPSFGMFFKLNMPYLSEKLFLQYEVTYSKRTFSTEYSSYESSPYIYDISIEQNMVGNKLVLRYELPRKKNGIVMQGGYVLNKYINQKYNALINYVQGGNIIFSDELPDADLYNKYEGAFTIGIGGVLKLKENRDLYIDLNYQRGQGLFNLGSSNFYSNTFVLNLSMPLGK